ncbi:helix-turn-helix domain-containing protein [Cyanobium sp. HWJ4-Hawea]|uniref:helix-turn-helix domain-containing protein n=1 Tax=Cyanobium sp. HWJ4-Hawea TaxID=2823713 RepID=UPI0020CFE4FF|nr:helix-turn-helix transcriptional regulator [Cyanobium sp. HWJ4-Hawea]MCP9810004.1 helix-turn-helix domain-containing protein [Cyanobium sp. HWJ4-Hawea]
MQPEAPNDPLLALGAQLREARERRGLNLRQLAEVTRISAAVLEALERGWGERLPEATYLRTMLSLLEGQLNLPAGCLDGVLAYAGDHENEKPTGLRAFRLRSRAITLGSIDVFTNWHGTWIYGALSLGLLYGINLQQQRLAAEGLLALQPVPPLSATQARQLAKPKGEQQLLQLYPDLRPLELAAKGQALKLLQAEARQPSRGQPGQPGQLRIQISQPSQITLESQGGVRSKLQASQGELVLQISPPFRLSLNPAPKAAGTIEWNGEVLPPLDGGKPDGGKAGAGQADSGQAVFALPAQPRP